VDHGDGGQNQVFFVPRNPTRFPSNFPSSPRRRTGESFTNSSFDGDFLKGLLASARYGMDLARGAAASRNKYFSKK
jgi:hypothetical protein